MIDINSIQPGTTTVLIGPNGSGKSRLLRELCVNFLRRGDEVIAIAPTIYDRFGRMPQRGLNFFGARQGRIAARNVIQSALKRASSENPQILKNLTQALKYTNFDPCVGMRIANIDERFLAKEDSPFTDSEYEEFRSALSKFRNSSDPDGIVRLSLDSYSFQEVSGLSLGILAGSESILFKSGAISRIEYILFRNGEPIPLLEACSGEINFITTIAFISTQIERRSIIAIDEPDTSLHPTWQKIYVKTLLDLFDYYEPRIVISTHSPIIISGAEATSGNVTVYEMTNGEARKFDHTKLSLEEMYDRLFGLITPKNHYLSQRAVSLLNSLNSKDRNLRQVVDELEELREKSYDVSQREVIRKVESMARELDTMGRGPG